MVSLSISTLSALVLALVVKDTAAHIVLWHDAMFGWDQSNINQNDAVTPLADMTFDEWWFHGYKDKKPAEGKFIELPVGGVFKGEVACNKAQTTWNPEITDESQLDEFACHDVGPMHTTDAKGSENPTNVKGCGLAIAYTSDENTVKPSDFTVFSVDHACPWKRRVDFPVPADLPACPEGGCLCSWGWVHSPESGSEQMYHTVYRCKVTGATETRALPAPLTANKCDYPSNSANCTVGGKQPHYWLQKEGNNNFQDYYDPPYYNEKYGFMQGAQTDLFAGIAPSRPTVVAESSVVPSSTLAAVVSSTDVPSAQPTLVVESSTTDTTSSTSTSASVVSSTSSSAIATSSSSAAPTSAVSSTSSTQASTSVSSSAAPATTTKSTGKTCKRSLHNNVVRQARRHTRAARMAATVESIRQRDVLLDRQRLLAEGLAIMARSKLV